MLCCAYCQIVVSALSLATYRRESAKTPSATAILSTTTTYSNAPLHEVLGASLIWSVSKQGRRSKAHSTHSIFPNVCGSPCMIWFKFAAFIYRWRYKSMDTRSLRLALRVSILSVYHLRIPRLNLTLRNVLSKTVAI